MALVALVLTAFSLAAPAAYAALAPDNSAATQVLTWTAGDGYMGYTSAPTTAVAGPATIVFENSAATGNTTGMPHTLTFDTSNPDYNTDVSLNIQASPSDSSAGRHTAEVTLTPGVYHYYCAMPGHMMSGELTVTAAPGDDTTAPDTSASVSGTKDASGDYVDSATVTLSASDSGSGVDTIEYALDGAAYATYTDAVRVSGAGRHTLAYRATDKAGNTSAVKSVSFTVVAAPPEDTTPPETSATVSGTKDASGDYVSGATVTVTASDTGSGVAGIEYALDGGAYRDYTAPVLVSDVGRHTLAYRATDKAGNTSAVKSVSFTVVAAPPEDTTPPETSATVSGTKDASGDYVSGATVTVTASDTGSGVAGIEYALDGGAYRDYTAPVLVSDVGRHTLAYRATDKAGNTSAAQTVSFTVVAAPPQDTTPPEVSASVSGTKDASGNYVGGATVTVTASDSGSGVAATEYSLDGGPYLPYSAPVAVDRAGSHTFLYRATDKAGNTSAAKSLTLTVVDSKPPTNCPETDDRSTVFAGTLDTGIPNRVTTNGCTINELIEDHRAWASHGAFVSHVEKLVADLRNQGVVDQREAGDIKKAAGRCDVGKVHSAHTER
ncbi:OmpL47-type beta-barrel domain-containing protein [Streptomyces sp. NPDC048192]|uniref:OmpL47-type beta-barrel domain-containing protein n=1 Tax=Streptomyces sp. NPDC048192 TaxID=3365510 RepID=UPI0037193F2C